MHNTLKELSTEDLQLLADTFECSAENLSTKYYEEAFSGIYNSWEEVLEEYKYAFSKFGEEGVPDIETMQDLMCDTVDGVRTDYVNISGDRIALFVFA